MAEFQFSSAALIESPPARVYQVIADYRDLHPKILPEPYFVSLQVEQGGVGAGTVIRFQMRLMGQLQEFHSTVAEPEPGRVLTETDADKGTKTTFTVEPRADGTQSFVTISTTVRVRDGIMGKFQGWSAALVIRPIYGKELDKLATVAAAPAPAPVPAV